MRCSYFRRRPAKLTFGVYRTRRVSCMELGKSLRTAARASRRGRAAGLAAAAAAAVLAAGCSSGTAASPAASDPVSSSSSSTVQTTTVTSVVAHWGSFFDNRNVNAGTSTRPAAITVPGTVAEVGSSNSTEYALLTNGSLYAWGLGGAGELGNGQDSDSLTQAVKVDFPPGVRIAWIPGDVMPYDTALAVDTRGNIWGWGQNAIGELCLGNDTSYSKPVRLPFTHVTAAAGAADHDLYDASGTVWACGQNVQGDLGDGRTAGTTTRVRVVGLNGRDVSQLITSFANSGALMKDGTYYDWGYNGNGQLGDGKPGVWSDVPVRVKLPAPVRQVALGGSVFNNGETLTLLANGELFAWGDNHAGQLGLGHLGMRALPARFFAPKGVTYKLLAAGAATGYAIATSGDVYAWGVSHVGQVGNGSLSVVLTPVQVASGATMISSTANNVVIDTPNLAGSQSG
jgi:alpha-tubulin suppressor-like RCC1 family protein